MFGIDFEALILLAVLAFILFGPEKLPEYAGKLGYYLAKLKAASSELTQQAQASFNNLAAAAAPAGDPHPRARLAALAEVYERPCPVCAHLVSQDFQFCPKCGAHLKEETATPATPESLTTSKTNQRSRDSMTSPPPASADRALIRPLTNRGSGHGPGDRQ